MRKKRTTDLKDRRIKQKAESPWLQQPTCTFVQSATESVNQGSGSSHTKEVIDHRIILNRHQCEAPSSWVSIWVYIFIIGTSVNVGVGMGSVNIA